MTDPTLVPVAVACRCPGTPHDGDSVYLRPVISLYGGIATQELIAGADPSRGSVTAAIVDGFLRREIVAWTFTDEKDKAVPVTEANIERLILSDFAYATPIADAASELYADTVIRPLVDAALKSSGRSPTNGSTSARKGRSSKRRKQPKPSLTPTTPTADIETTSP
jgi:hypothetical protein